MTTINQAREAIYDLFTDAWAVTVPTPGLRTPITYDNEKYDPPDTAWVRLSVRHTGSTQETLGPAGSRSFMRQGIAFVQIFTPSDKGVAEADTLARVAALAFEGERIVGTSVRFLDVVTRETGPEGKWFGVVVQANFEYDETR